MKFFKKMNEKETVHSKKGMIFGFSTYMLTSAIHYFYYLSTERMLFSPGIIFWSGLFAFFAFEFMLNLKDKLAKDV